jgi:hypothetical protein
MVGTVVRVLATGKPTVVCSMEVLKTAALLMVQ